MGKHWHKNLFVVFFNQRNAKRVKNVLKPKPKLNIELKLRLCEELLFLKKKIVVLVTLG